MAICGRWRICVRWRICLLRGVNCLAGSGTRKEGERILAEAVASARNGKIEADGKLLVIDHAGQRISDAVEQEAENWHADLIVIGTHGRRGFRRLLLGSVAENLIRISASPVLLIRGA